MTVAKMERIPTLSEQFKLEEGPQLTSQKDMNFSAIDESIKSDMFWWSCKNIKVCRNLEALWKSNSEKKWNEKRKKHETSTTPFSTNESYAANPISVNLK